VTYDRAEQEVGYVFERLYVVCLRRKSRLLHFVELVEVDCLGLAVGCTSKSLVRRNANHLVTAQDHRSHGHIQLKLIFHFVHAFSLARNDPCVLPRVNFVLFDRLQAHVDQLLASVSEVII